MHASTWWPSVPRSMLHTRGGFVDRIAVTETGLQHAHLLLLDEPVTAIEIVEATSGMAFPHARWHPRIRRFAAGGQLDGTALRALATSALSAKLVAVDLGGCHLARELEPLGDALPACRELVLADNLHLGRHLPRLLDWKHRDRLEVLDLSRCSVTPEVLAAILARDLARLRVLRLSQNPLGDAGAVVIERALPRLRALRRLELVGCQIDAIDQPDVAIVTDEGDLARRVTLDLVSVAIDLVQLAPDAWAIEIDGERRQIRWQRGRSVGRSQRILEDWVIADTAPLGPLATALLTGAKRNLVGTTGACVYPRLTHAYAYTEYVESIESIHIDRPDAANQIAIRFWEHVEVD